MSRRLAVALVGGWATLIARRALLLYGLPVACCLLAAFLMVVSSPAPLAGRDRPPLAFLPVLLLGFASYAGVGALVASRRPSNPVGWIFWLIGLFFSAGFMALGYGDYALLVRPGELPGGELAVWVWTWSGGLFLLGPTLIFLLFPTGRLPSPRWVPLVWLAGAGGAGSAGAAALSPGYLPDYSPRIENPLGSGGAIGELAASVADPAGALMLLAFFLSLVAMIVRLRGAHGVERQQLKWFTYACGVLAAAGLASVLAPGREGALGDAIFVVVWLALVAIPVAAAIAILRHRLFDIDLVINRTLVYGALTACLALAYWASVVLLGQLLRPLTSESDLAIAASTLAVAALFRPLRGRIQAVVDHRFYRRSYDAARTLESFSARLRDQVDLDALSVELEAVVSETMAPAQVSLWLRPRRADEAAR